MKLKVFSLSIFILTLLISIDKISPSEYSTINSIKTKTEEKKSVLSSKTLVKTDSTSQMKSLFSISSKKFGKLTSKQRFSGYPRISLSDSTLGKGPIYCQGWNRYFKSEPGNRAKAFYINSEYKTQNNNKFYNKQSKASKLNSIRSNNHFYFVGGKEGLSVYTSQGKV
jgi:hypothetical protein